MDKRRFSILEEDGVEFSIQREHEIAPFDIQKEDKLVDLEIFTDNQLVFLKRLTISGKLIIKGKLGIL